jgi:hypothetical protein
MRKFDKLRKQALAASKAHGHTMRRNGGTYRDYNGGMVAVWNCKHCGAWLRVETIPAPNSIDISGSVFSCACRESQDA